MEKTNKKLAIVSILLAVIITGIGVSFGYFLWNSANNTDISFTVEGAVVELSDGTDIKGANLMPVINYTAGGSDVVKKDIKIKLKDNVTSDVTVDFKLKINSIDSGLKHSSFKYNLVNASGTSVSSGDFATSKAGDSISLLSLSSTNGTLTTSLTGYTLYIYIDGTVDNPSSMMNQSFDFSFVVDGSNSTVEHISAVKKVESLDDGSTGDSGSGVYKVTHSAIPAESSATGSEIPAVTDYRYYGPNPNNYILLPDMNTTESRCMINDKELLNPSMGEWPANFDCENEVVYKLDGGSSVNLYIPASTFEIVAPAGSMTYNETNNKCLYNGSSIGSMYEGNIDKNVCMKLSVIELPLQGTSSALITKMNDKPHKLNVKNGLYRIIGSIYDERSKTNRLKVIKATPLTDGTTSLYSWDADISNKSYTNIWSTPTSGNFSNSLSSGASIMKLLNSGAWWNGTSGTYDNFYIDKEVPETINVNFTNYKLSDKAKSNIDISRYYLGGYNNNPPLTNEMYGYERGTLRYDENRPLYWDGMVGLMYPSDYGYAAGNVCATGTELFNYFGECSNKDWLYKTGVNQWLMSPYSGYSYFVLNVGFDGQVNGYHSNFALAVSPVFYLSSSASITGGNGTLDAPYILS